MLGFPRRATSGTTAKNLPPVQAPPAVLGRLMRRAKEMPVGEAGWTWRGYVLADTAGRLYLSGEAKVYDRRDATVPQVVVTRRDKRSFTANLDHLGDAQIERFTSFAGEGPLFPVVGYEYRGERVPAEAFE